MNGPAPGRATGLSAIAALFALALGSGCLRRAPDHGLKDFSCRMEPVTRPDTQSIAAGRMTVQFKVVNLSQAPWPAGLPGDLLKHLVTFGSHWIPGDGAEKLDGGPRARLFEDLEAGGSVVVDQFIDPPPLPGLYLLRIQPVQEHIAWFADTGGCKLEFQISVTP